MAKATSMRIAVLTGWHFRKVHSVYSVSSTHYLYIDYLSHKFKQVYLISPVEHTEKNIKTSQFQTLHFPNVKLIELPFFRSYKQSILKFPYFFKAIKQISTKVDLFYCRVPDPFAWLPAFFLKKPVIMHYVGDALEALWAKKQLSYLNRIFQSLVFLPEFILTLMASAKSRTFTNGHHIANKLSFFKISATAVISSTLGEQDFCNRQFKPTKCVKLIYVGYLRAAKGVSTLISMAKILKERQINFELTIIGSGEIENQLKDIVADYKLTDSIQFLGHVDNRKQLNKHYRDNDIFLFPSLSEGSPRVVLEAMANSLSVISTSVGSLPYIFSNNKDISFAEPESGESFANEVENQLKHVEETNQQVQQAFNKVKSKYTIDSFLGKIFSNET